MEPTAAERGDTDPLTGGSHLLGTLPAAPQPTNPNLRRRECQIAPGIKLIVCPREAMEWDQFVREAPPYSIALDGVVKGPPRRDMTGPWVNFNHHEGVDRHATRSTCAQVAVALKQGLAEAFTTGRGVEFNIYVNDPDQDTSLAVWLLANHERITGSRSEPLINRIVHAEDVLDTTGGAYPFDPKSHMMRELAWVFEPYTSARVSGRIGVMDAAEMYGVIQGVCANIDRYTLGKGSELVLDTSYDVLGGNGVWKLIRETGPYAKTGLFADGGKAYVSLICEQDGVYRYSIGKMSPYIRFPVEDLYQIFNVAEGIPADAADRWNGSDTVGGSPRIAGSTLKPADVERIINELLSVQVH